MMTDRDQTQAAATGCLSRVFTLIGLFWVGVVVVNAIGAFQSGGGNFDLTGGLFPAAGFLFAGSVMRKRAREAATSSDTFSAPSTPTGTHKATTKKPSSERGPTPSPTLSADADTAATKEASKKNRPVPELPPIEPAPDPGKLPAIESLELSDFEPDRPMTSEERIQKAREKYLRKKP